MVAGWVRRALASVMVAVVATVGLVGAASGATPPDPLTTVRVVRTHDGTGHGTGSACFINNVNGFPVGDEAPADGVVCSGDTVGYQVEVAFAAGPARRVHVDVHLPDDVALVGSTLGTSGAIFTATQRSPLSFTYDVRRGGVETVTRDVLVRAVDTGGLTVPDGRVTVDVSADGGAVFSTATSEAVTVVSAPRSDVSLSGPVFGFDQRSAGRGQLMVAVSPLTVAGFSPSKGASTGQGWSGRVDVSAFPAGTTFTVGGVNVPVVDGTVSVSGTRGLTVAFQLPAGSYPVMSGEASVSYPARIFVDEGSFTSPGGALNNVNGSQPGDGLSCDVSTRDDSTGAKQGVNAPNNDCAVVTFAAVELASASVSPVTSDPVDPEDPVDPGAGDPEPEPVDPNGEVTFEAGVYAPFDSTEPVFDVTNRLFSESDAERALTVSWNESLRAAPGTELDARMMVDTSAFTPQSDMPAGVCGMWNAPGETEVMWDASRPLTVTGPDGSALDPSTYRVAYAGDSSTGCGTVASLTVENGWVDSHDAPAGVAVVFDGGALPSGPGGGVFTVHAPLRMLDSYDPFEDGAGVFFRMSGLVGDVAADPVTVVWRVALGSDPYPMVVKGANRSTVPSGDPVEYMVRVGARDLMESDQLLNVTVVDALDRCAVDPALLSRSEGVWDMAVIPAVPGESGGVCGDPTSTPARLVFTPDGGSVPVSSFNAARDEGWVDVPVEYRVRPTILTPVGAGPYTMSNAVEVSFTGVDGSVSDDVDVTVLEDSGSSANMSPVPALVDVPDTVAWEWVVTSRSGTVTQPTSTVLALPHVGDARLLNGVDVSYDGPSGSSFSGSFSVGSVSVRGTDTTPGTTVWFTTDDASGLTLDPDDGSVSWHLVGDAGQGGVPLLGAATGLRVDVPSSAGTAGAVVDVALVTDGAVAGDVFLLWSGVSDRGDGFEPLAAPWPAAVRLVDSSVSGTVWWDESNDGRPGGGEPGVDGVTVTLHTVSEGVLSDVPVASTVTGADGSYVFGGLVSGTYAARVDRSSVVGDVVVIPSDVVTLYGEVLPVSQTFSASDRFFGASRLDSTPVTLGVGGVAGGVNFGFYRPDPLVIVDKSAATVGLVDDAGLVDVSWTVSAVNVGNTVVPDLVVSDRLSEDVFGVTARLDVFRSDAQIVKVDAGQFHSVALDSNGDLWDFTSAFEPRNRSEQYRDTLGQVDLVDVSASGSVTVAVDENGDVWRRDTISSAPVNVSAANRDTFGSVRVVSAHTGGPLFMVDEFGDLWAWGVNSHGQLGIGSTVEVSTPVNVSAENRDTFGAVDVVKVAPSGFHVLALDVNGDVWVWGWRFSGGLGDGLSSNTDVTRPLNLTAFSASYPFGQVDVVDVTVGDSYSMVADSNGDVWTWGYYLYNVLGTGTTTNQSRPVNVSAVNESTLGQVDIANVSSNGRSSYAVDTTGDLWAWGDNLYGKLGTGDTVNQEYPVNVSALNGDTIGAAGVVFVHGGEPHSVALTTDGAVWRSGGSSASTTTTYWVDMTDPGLCGTEDAPTVCVPWPPMSTILSTGLAPTSTTTDDGWVTRVFNTGEMPPGATVEVTVSGKVRASNVERVIVNQAWVDGETVPYASLTGRAAPDVPTVPTVEAFDAAGVPGNVTCSADPNQGAEDSCDQVPALIPASPVDLGGVSGLVWDDVDRDGVRGDGEPALSGVRVGLFTVDGVTRLGDTVTGPYGAYEFVDVPSGGYVVWFEVVNVTDGAGGRFIPTVQGAGSDGTVDSDVDGDGAVTVTVTAPGVTSVDAGVVRSVPALTVVKEAATGGVPVMSGADVPAGTVVDWVYTVTNSGTVRLDGVTVVDVFVESGVDGVVDVSCPSTSLLPGGSMVCTGSGPVGGLTYAGVGS